MKHGLVPGTIDIDNEQGEKAFSVVGVGASAGGLEAFTQLLTHLDDDTGMAFVLIQHLDPLHDSKLTELLAKATSMPLVEVTEGMTVCSNHVYVIPKTRTWQSMATGSDSRPVTKNICIYRSITSSVPWRQVG